MLNKKGIGIIKGIFLFLLLLVVIVVGSAYYWLKKLGPEKILQSSLVQEQIKKTIPTEDQLSIDLVSKLLGFEKPMTFLLLFENNTELRPGGGFIGVYALVNLDKGKMKILEMDGTENLDKNAPKSWKVEPPVPIKEHLKVDRWYFRDANWSPDFGESAKKAIEFYLQEKSVTTTIDGVIGFTPTTIEELLKIIGSVTVQGIEFTPENIVEKLEYEVEYGYDDRGVVRQERKQIIQPLMLEIISRFKKSVLFNASKYLELVNKLVDEKQIMIYLADPNLQLSAKNQDWTGEIKTSSTDYLLWVDANLAALKTDHALIRTLGYQIVKQKDGRYLAYASMHYQNNGKFDWRTTRYRTYARIYVPVGSELELVEQMNEMGQNIKIIKVDQGEELGKKWFGAFMSIEPGDSKYLIFSYSLPKIIVQQIENGEYNLIVQKQLGLINSGLTLDLNFDKNIVRAEPAEIQKEWGDTVYKFNEALNTDKSFSVLF